MATRFPGPDADTRRALLLILTVLERHSRALRTLLVKAGRPELEGLLGALERRERALREAAWQLRARAAPDAAGPTDRRRGSADGLARQGVLPLPERTPGSARHPGLGSGLGPNGTDGGALRRATHRAVIHSAVERWSDKLGTRER